MRARNHRIHSVLLLLGLMPLAACADESADTPSEQEAATDGVTDDETAPVDVSVEAAPPGALVLTMMDGPTDKSASCGGFDPCGIVYNRSSQTLQLARDSKSHFYCKQPKNFRDLPPGGNSNRTGPTHWPDVDCVRSNHGWIVTNGRAYPPGEWIRVWASKWIY